MYQNGTEVNIELAGKMNVHPPIDVEFWGFWAILISPQSSILRLEWSQSHHIISHITSSCYRHLDIHRCWSMLSTPGCNAPSLLLLDFCGVDGPNRSKCACEHRKVYPSEAIVRWISQLETSMASSGTSRPTTFDSWKVGSCKKHQKKHLTDWFGIHGSLTFEPRTWEYSVQPYVEKKKHAKAQKNRPSIPQSSAQNTAKKQMVQYHGES